MQNDEHNPAEMLHVSRSNHQISSGTIQLSANTTRRLEKLARWRIDPALIEFPKGTPKFEGGHATVSQALLDTPMRDTNTKLAESNVCGLKPSNCASNTAGHREEAEVDEQKEKRKDEAPNERGEQESDYETSERRKAVAIKKMKFNAPGETMRVLCLTVREAEFLVKLSYKHIIKLEGFVEDVSNNMIWLIFPWEGNGTLKDFVGSHDWEIPERISLIYDVARGVEYLHSRVPPIIHGDLKSINVLVSSKCRAIITDFGSACHPAPKNPTKERERPETESRPSEATAYLSTNTITLSRNHYTLRWAAPELLAEDGASLASDIWALGWVAYEVMRNSIPFQDVKDTVVVRRVTLGDLPSISSDARMLLVQALCTLVGQCWNVEPSDRPTAENCRNALKWMPMITPNPARIGDGTGAVDRCAELFMTLGRMYLRQSDYPKASEYYAKALGIYTNMCDKKGKANALRKLAQVHGFQDEYNEAAILYSECLQIRTDIGDSQGRADALEGLADLHRLRDEYSRAVNFYTECLQIWTDIGNKKGRAIALWGLADVHRLRKEYIQAVASYSECLQIRADIGDSLGRADALWGLADVHRLRKEYNQAVTLYSACLQIRTDIGDKQGRADALWGLAETHWAQKEHSRAVACYSECLQIFTDIGDAWGIALGLWGLANVHLIQHKYMQAMVFYFNALKLALTGVNY